MSHKTNIDKGTLGPSKGTAPQWKLPELKWRNRETEVPSLECGDKLLVAVPLSKGGYDFCSIVTEEIGFSDDQGDNWGAWSWDDVEYYCFLGTRTLLVNQPEDAERESEVL